MIRHYNSKIADGSHLGFGKIAITLPRIEGFGSNFVRRYKIAR